MRLTRSADGIVADGSSDGRGAWVCRRDGAGTPVDDACLDAAFAKRGFARAWRCEITPEDERRIRALVARRAGGDEPADAR